jgi:hypothetical protein
LFSVKKFELHIYGRLQELFDESGVKTAICFADVKWLKRREFLPSSLDCEAVPMEKSVFLPSHQHALD